MYGTAKPPGPCLFTCGNRYIPESLEYICSVYLCRLVKFLRNDLQTGKDQKSHIRRRLPHISNNKRHKGSVSRAQPCLIAVYDPEPVEDVVKQSVLVIVDKFPHHCRYGCRDRPRNQDCRTDNSATFKSLVHYKRCGEPIISSKTTVATVNFKVNKMEASALSSLQYFHRVFQTDKRIPAAWICQYHLMETQPEGSQHRGIPL